MAEASKPNEDRMQELVGLISKATPEVKESLRKALSVPKAIEQAKPRARNADARVFVQTVGDAYHPNPPANFPKPSEGMLQKDGGTAGPNVERFKERWAAGKSFTSKEAERYGLNDAEALADSSHM